jgi:hypothetical protein
MLVTSFEKLQIVALQNVSGYSNIHVFMAISYQRNKMKLHAQLLRIHIPI